MICRHPNDQANSWFCVTLENFEFQNFNRNWSPPLCCPASLKESFSALNSPKYWVSLFWGCSLIFRALATSRHVSLMLGRLVDTVMFGTSEMDPCGVVPASEWMTTSHYASSGHCEGSIPAIGHDRRHRSKGMSARHWGYNRWC